MTVGNTNYAGSLHRTSLKPAREAPARSRGQFHGVHNTGRRCGR
jgi:hypothetical protein